jgi:hypothetical protein
MLYVSSIDLGEGRAVAVFAAITMTDTLLRTDLRGHGENEHHGMEQPVSTRRFVAHF